jgi:hypothetical protein
LGQRRTLLRPLIKKRHPKIIRKNASAMPTHVECSKVPSAKSGISPHYMQRPSSGQLWTLSFHLADQ